MSWSDDFPRLTAQNHRVTSPATPKYNCVGWAAGDLEHWWQPGVHWLPPDWPPDDFGMGALEQLFFQLGYEDCNLDATLEPGVLKVALYGYGFTYTHAARQLPSGKWTSKLGKGEDIEHNTPDDVAGGLYGEVAEIVKKPGTNPASA